MDFLLWLMSVRRSYAGRALGGFWFPGANPAIVGFRKPSQKEAVRLR
jgi:hypothetical protein